MTVTTPQGFRAAGTTAGLKDSGRPDLALVVNDGPSRAAAAVFTTNRVQAAPVKWSRQVVADGRVDAVVLNSGGANACTGATGFQNTHATAEHLATILGLSATDVAVCSTGLIGTQLPMDRLLPGVAAAAADLGSAEHYGVAAATAIMTTDTVTKTAVGNGDGWSIGGMAKGAAMLAPGLATMLVVLTTDADVAPPRLDAALKEACRTTFERVDSDGCMSTNDTVLLLASAASSKSPTQQEFQAVLTGVCADLASQLLADAEGAAHDIAITVTSAVNENEAVEVARAVARSNLFKCAVFGRDPNWGRVLSAVGTTAAAFDPDTLDVSMNGVMVCRDGAVGDDPAKVDLTGRDLEVVIDLKAGLATATVWTNDLTHDYVHENSAYST